MLSLNRSGQVVENYFEKFLSDPLEYENSEKYWGAIWGKVVRATGVRDVWSTPWVGTGSPLIKDGNPIFSAIAPIMRRGVRIVQLAPVEPGLDFQIWLDTFGDDPRDPESINELVIACVLSDVAAVQAESCMMDWAMGKSLTFRSNRGGQLVPRPTSQRNWDLLWVSRKVA